jgi:uncharacterized damage-inducible protein DinB
MFSLDTLIAVSGPDIFRRWYEQEKDGDQKILSMLDSVSIENRETEEFTRAANLALHLVACRMNWLARIEGQAPSAGDWWPSFESLDHLRSKFSEIESLWERYLATLDEDEFSRDFEYMLVDGKHYRWNVGHQLMQLVGHAFYHRGQIALLVDRLGGTMVDTDYLYWVVSNDDRYGRIRDDEPPAADILNNK